MRNAEPKETIEEFYWNRPCLIPYGLKNESGNFNVFDITEQAWPGAKYSTAAPKRIRERANDL